MKLNLTITETERQQPMNMHTEKDFLDQLVAAFAERYEYYLQSLFTPEFAQWAKDMIDGDTIPNLLGCLRAEQQVSTNRQIERDEARASIEARDRELAGLREKLEYAEAVADSAQKAHQNAVDIVAATYEKLDAAEDANEKLRAENMRLKARLYDFEHAADAE